MPRSVRAGLVYFALVFAVGCVLGPVREFVLAPRLGDLTAVLIESPIMLAAAVVAARRIVRRHALDRSPGSAAIAGLVALLVLIAAELAGSLGLRGMSLAAYSAAIIAPAGIVSLVLFAAFAAMPLLVALRTRG